MNQVRALIPYFKSHKLVGLKTLKSFKVHCLVKGITTLLTIGGWYIQPRRTMPGSPTQSLNLIATSTLQSPAHARAQSHKWKNPKPSLYFYDFPHLALKLLKFPTNLSSVIDHADVITGPWWWLKSVSLLVIRSSSPSWSQILTEQGASLAISRPPGLYSFIQQIFNKHQLCTWHSYRYQGHIGEQNG